MTSNRLNHQLPDRDLQVPRAAAIVGLGGVALIHLLEVQGKYDEVPYLGIGYALLIVACVIAGALLVHRNDRRAWLLGGGASAATLLGYVLTRTVGLPQSSDDIGNWLEPMGLASIFIEAIVTGVAAYALVVGRRSQVAVRSDARSFASAA